MKLLDHMMDHICEELEGAWGYAEKYLENKARGDHRYQKYREMAMDEISHAETIYGFTATDIENLRKVYTLTTEEDEKWLHLQKRFAEKVSLLRQVLAN